MSNITGSTKQIDFANTIINTLIGMADEASDGSSDPASIAVAQRNATREQFRQTAKVIRALVDQGVEAAQDAIEQNEQANVPAIQSVIDAEGVVKAGEAIDALKGAFYNLAN